MTNTDELITERTGKHGEFLENSRATWAILGCLMAERNWPTLSAEDKHALYMISHKMARIVCGDPLEPDHWDDISGYAQVRVDRIREPREAYNSQDLYGSVALAWGVSRDEAKRRMMGMMYNRSDDARTSQSTGRRSEIQEQMKRDLLASQAASQGAAEGRGSPPLPTRPGGPASSATDERPGTPADGGQHGNIVHLDEDDLDLTK